MKRYHIIGISMLLGLIAGLSVSKAADAKGVDVDHSVSMYQCEDGSKSYNWNDGGNEFITVHGEVFIYANQSKEGDSLFINQRDMGKWLAVKYIGGEKTALFTGSDVSMVCD